MRLLGGADVLAQADQAFRRAAGEARAAISDESRCYFGHSQNSAGQRISDQRLWCGPVLLRNSQPTRPWVSYALRTSTGDSFGTARLAPATVGTLTSTTALAPGTELFRPDAKPPPTNVQLVVPT